MTSGSTTLAVDAAEVCGGTLKAPRSPCYFHHLNISTTVQVESTQEPKKKHISICLENAFPSQKCIFDYFQKVLKIKK